MQGTTVADSLGARIVSAARLAVEMHLAMSDQQPSSLQKAMIGGTDRRVTDDTIPLSVVSGPSSVVDDSNN
jgi:hypothetical protein